MSSLSMRKFNMIEEVNPKRETWRVRVRIIRLYKVPMYNNPQQIKSLDMVLMDEKNAKIHATVKIALIRSFEHLLKEGELCTITNFGVMKNTDKLKTCANEYMINFYKTTSVRTCEPIPIPIYGFDFVNFDDIISKKLSTSVFIDIIGLLTGVSPVETTGADNDKKDRMKIELEDKSNNRINVILWNSFAETMSRYISDNKEPTIVALQFAKFNVFKGGFSISNSFYASRLLMNPEIPETKELLTSLVESEESHVLTQISSGNPISVEDEFMKLSLHKTLHEIPELTQECYVAVLATTVYIETEHGWFYNTCNTCTGKVVSEGSGLFSCEICNVTVKYVVPRYKITFRVEDETGVASFAMFDRDVYHLTNIKASVLRDNQIKDDDCDMFPPEFDVMLDKQFLFRIHITNFNLKNNWPIYSISRVTEDPGLISAHLEAIKSTQIRGTKTDQNQLSGEEASIQISTDDNNESESVTCDNYDIQSTPNSNLTPAKRSFSRAIPEAVNLNLDSSDNQMSTSKKVVVKLEKVGKS